MDARSYQGRCHCGAIGFLYTSALPGEGWSIRACQCSFCRAHDALSTSDPAGELEFRVTEPDALQRYRFGGRTADFLICRRCGVYIGAQMRSGERIFGIINLRALQQPPVGLPAAVAMTYDGESTDERRIRREARWTPLTRTV
jgi:hypothetical protein